MAAGTAVVGKQAWFATDPQKSAIEAFSSSSFLL